MQAMYGSYNSNSMLVSPDDLTAFAWSAPMRDLAAKIGISDVGLKKLLSSKGIVLPPQGHWNRVHAGRPVPNHPRIRPRRPGEWGRIQVDTRFRSHVPEAPLLPSGGPFATAFVPEELVELYEQELRAIGRAVAPKSLDNPHRGIAHMIRAETLRREKAAKDPWFLLRDEERFSGPLDRRKLRLLNGVFLALAKRGHDASAFEHNETIEVRITIGDTPIGISLEIEGKHRTEIVRGWRRPARDLPASTPLMLSVHPGFGQETSRSWKDDETGSLETKVAAIAAGLITEGEGLFRRSLREVEERAERERLKREEEERKRQAEAERRKAARLAKLQEERLAELYRSGELMRQARDIRALVPLVRASVEGIPGIDSNVVDNWQGWALDAADQLDPVMSGQVLKHLLPPTAGEEPE